MTNFPVDTALLHIRQAWSPCIFNFLAAARILLLAFGLLRGQCQDLHLVRGQAESVDVFRRQDDGVVRERLQVERGEVSLVTGNLGVVNYF